MITLWVGIVRVFELVGSALAFGIAAARVQQIVDLTIAFVAFAICIVPTHVVTFIVPDHPREREGTKRRCGIARGCGLSTILLGDTISDTTSQLGLRIYRPLNHLIFIFHSTADRSQLVQPRMELACKRLCS